MASTKTAKSLATRSGKDKAESGLVSVIIPAYNESRTIKEILRRVLSVPLRIEVLIVNDGSSDSTKELIENLVDQENSIFAVHHTKNRGKGRAIRTALESCTGEFVLIQDADLEYDPVDFVSVLAPLMSDEFDLVLGSRYSDPRKCVGRVGVGSLVAVKIINLAVRLVYGTRVTDTITCYKACKTEWLKSVDLKCERFEFCTEVLAKAIKSKLRIKEVPIRYTPRTTREGKKIGWRDGWHLLVEVYRWRNWRPGISSDLSINSGQLSQND